MSLPLLVSLYEFRQFLNIVLWIAVPATVIAVLITIYFHYRRKKHLPAHEALLPEEAGGWSVMMAEPAPDLPDWLASGNPDNTTLLKKYEHEVRRYRENYANLEQEFRQLEEKYTDLRNKAYSTGKEEHNKDAFNKEKEQYEAELARYTTLVDDLKAENRRLQEMLSNGHVPEDITRLHEENKALKEKLYEQEYLPDVLEEKKLQIDFLQKQLEQRIKNSHTLEQQATQATARLQELQMTVARCDEQIRQLTGDLQVKQETLAGEQQKSTALETKLEHSSVLLSKIYHELSESLDKGLMNTNITEKPFELQVS